MNFEIAPKSTEIQATWDDARLYFFSLNIDGKTGWRLPTKKELNIIYESENDLDESWYWSSTKDNRRLVGVYGKNLVWGQHFYWGGQSHGPKDECGFARAVRSKR